MTVVYESQRNYFFKALSGSGTPSDPFVALSGGGGGGGGGLLASAAPTVTAGAYTAGFIMGGLMTFAFAAASDEPVFLDALEIAFKVAVNPSVGGLTLVLFDASPSGTTTTDHVAYSLATTDTFKVRLTIPIFDCCGYLVSHGTPTTVHLSGIDHPLKPVSGTVNLLGLLIDNTGLTLSSTSDLQVTLYGRGA